MTAFGEKLHESHQGRIALHESHQGRIAMHESHQGRIATTAPPKERKNVDYPISPKHESQWGRIAMHESHQGTIAGGVRGSDLEVYDSTSEGKSKGAQGSLWQADGDGLASSNIRSASTPSVGLLSHATDGDDTTRQHNFPTKEEPLLSNPPASVNLPKRQHNFPTKEEPLTEDLKRRRPIYKGTLHRRRMAA